MTTQLKKEYETELIELNKNVESYNKLITYFTKSMIHQIEEEQIFNTANDIISCIKTKKQYQKRIEEISQIILS
jgi:predicted secreted Zn-dependent protease